MPTEICFITRVFNEYRVSERAKVFRALYQFRASVNGSSSTRNLPEDAGGGQF